MGRANRTSYALRVQLSGVTGLGHDKGVKVEHAYMEEWRGVMVTLGRPEPTVDENVICGSDVMWPVLDRQLKSANGTVIQLSRTKYVCRHQIIAGD